MAAVPPKRLMAEKSLLQARRWAVVKKKKAKGKEKKERKKSHTLCSDSPKKGQHTKSLELDIPLTPLPPQFSLFPFFQSWSFSPAESEGHPPVRRAKERTNQAVEESRWLAWKAVGEPKVSCDWSTPNPLSEGSKKKERKKKKKVARVEKKIDDNNWSCGRGRNVSG